jgi:RNA polymerase sigma-70 factor (ECF subfamily)
MVEMAPREAFREALGPRAVEVNERVEAELRAAITRAREAWPHIVIPEADFARWLGTRLPEDLPLSDGLAQARSPELWLCCACARGEPRAFTAFEERYFPAADSSLRRLRASADMADEVRQQLRQKLFLPDRSGKPKVADYGGRGELGKWVRAVALRSGLNELKKGERERPADDDQLVTALASPGDDPELQVLKGRYAAQFKIAFRESLATLPDRSRALLRQYYLDGLTLEELGKLYRIHVSNVSRGLEKARQLLFSRTRRQLVKDLRVDGIEVDSLLRLIRSRLDVSLGGLMRSRTKPKQ